MTLQIGPVDSFSVGIELAFGLADFLDDAAGVADGKAIVGDAAIDDASCPDDAVFADGDAREDDDASADPGVLADVYVADILHLVPS